MDSVNLPKRTLFSTFRTLMSAILLVHDPRESASVRAFEA